MRVGSHFGWKIGQLEKLPEQFVNVPILLGRSFDKAAAGEANAQVVELFRRHRSIANCRLFVKNGGHSHDRVEYNTSFRDRICYRR